MDLLNTKRVFYEGQEYINIYFNEFVVWSIDTGEFSKDFKYLKEEDNFSGIYENNGFKI